MSTDTDTGRQPSWLAAVIIVLIDAIIVVVIVYASFLMWDGKDADGHSERPEEFFGILAARAVGGEDIGVSDVLAIAMVPVSLFMGIVVVQVMSDRNSGKVTSDVAISVGSLSDIEIELSAHENDGREAKLGRFTTFVRAVAFAATAILLLMTIFSVLPLARRSINGDGAWSVSHAYGVLLCAAGGLVMSFAVFALTKDTGWMKQHRTWADINLAMRQLHLRSAHMGEVFEAVGQGVDTTGGGSYGMAVTGMGARGALVRCRRPVTAVMAVLAVWPILALGAMGGLKGAGGAHLKFLAIVVVLFAVYFFFVVAIMSSRCLMHMNRCIGVASRTDGPSNAFLGVLYFFGIGLVNGIPWSVSVHAGKVTGGWIVLALTSIVMVTIWPFWISSPRIVIRLPKSIRPPASDKDGWTVVRDMRSLLWLKAFPGVSAKCWGKPFSTQLTRRLWSERTGAGRDVIAWPSSPLTGGRCPLCAERGEAPDEHPARATEHVDARGRHLGDRYGLCSVSQHGDLMSGRAAQLRRRP